MATVITKNTIETILGLDADTIDDTVYTWALAEFYTLTGFKATETQKWYRKFLANSTNFIQLPFINIKQIDSIKYDNVVQSTLSNFDGFTINPDTGLLKFSGGLAGGVFIEVQYTIDNTEYEDIHGFLIALLTYKAFATFQPQSLGHVRSIKIGKFSKTFGNTDSSLGNLLSDLDKEIINTRNIIIGDAYNLTYGALS